MDIFIFLILISIVGVGFIFINLKKETSPEEQKGSAAETPAIKTSTQEVDSLLNQFNFNIGKGKKIAENDLTKTPLRIEPLGTASLTTSPVEEKLSMTNPHNSDILEKYTKLEQLLQEKNKALKTAEDALNNELKNRQDFEKIKSLLENELMETKQRLKNAQFEINSFKERSEGFLKLNPDITTKEL
ncbi:MAG: hypothetical protein HQL24_10215 [Candidatus Omnitrophica bacterium]|nr:hypothetical protein [Candidatus Omnitrophota bacterium]